MVNTFEIGERIKRLRNLQGYTREEFSEMIDVSPRFVYDLELGNKGMSVNTLIKISKSLNVPADYLLFGEYKEYAEQSEILFLIEKCPESKISCLYEVIKNFILAVQ